MKSLSPLFLLSLLASVAIAACFVGCSKSENDNTTDSMKDKNPAFAQTPADETFAKAHGAVWLTTEIDPAQPTQLTVDFQDGLFSEGATLACALWVSDVQKENGVLVLTGNSLQTFGDFEIEITTNMLSSIRTAWGKNSLCFVRVAFQVESFKRVEDQSSESSDDSSNRYLIRGKAVAVEPIPDAEMKQK